MRMSTQFTVTVQMLMLIMVLKGKKVTSNMLSESTGANPIMIRQLYGKLKSAGILNVSTGMGVTTLARDPADISLWDIYMAVEEYSPNELFKFHPNISNGCQIGRFFKEILGVHLDEAVRAMGEKMERISLAQLLEEWEDRL
ncbi:Rrf2 family transcriptional regulator [Bacilliculturomica massiliensis]|uniref:Rrf2 family transcriptional regulator n=1 Tax=Bacilliculturomica massiliensis TaxID=1917867 RepID=UPI0010319EE6|nr:Rrf2 family transcriptional regulator [Bacilliculturomica massiliensis]